MTHKVDDLARQLELIAGLMRASPTKSGSPVIGISQGGGTGISSVVNSYGSHNGPVIGVVGTFQSGSSEETATVQNLERCAADIREGNAGRTAVDAALDQVMRFGSHVVDRATFLAAGRLVDAVFGTS